MDSYAGKTHLFIVNKKKIHPNQYRQVWGLPVCILMTDAADFRSASLSYTHRGGMIKPTHCWLG